MIRYVKLKNYKSLVDFEVNFMKNKTNPKNLILIYGENGIGKSNFANSFYTLNQTMRTMSSIEMIKKIIDNNSDSDFYKYFIDKHFKDIKMIINDCKTINSDDNLIMEFGFTIDDKNGVYYIEMNNEEIVNEKLEFVLNKNQTVFFEINKINIKYNFPKSLYY